MIKVKFSMTLKVSSDTWWISIADTDVLLYAKGLAIGQKLNVEISEPNVNPLAVQGPKSFELMKRVFGDEILNLKFFHFKRFLFQDHNFLIARSGWSKQGGFEIYVDNDEKGLELYDALYEKGKDLDVRPGCPNLIERIEGGLLSYGNDMNMNDTPFECGLDPFVSFNENVNYLGKSTLQEQKEKGVTRSLVGLKLQIDKISLSKTLSIFQNEQLIGDLRSACFSPKFQCCLGIAMIDTAYQNHSVPLNLMIDGQEIIAEMTSIPFTK